MHEMSIALQILQIATEALPESLDAEIERINLKIGKLSGIVPESLRYCFRIISSETVFSGADLHIDEAPLKLYCKGCRTTSTPDRPVFCCPYCEGEQVDILSGRELDILSIELADDDM